MQKIAASEQERQQEMAGITAVQEKLAEREGRVNRLDVADLRLMSRFAGDFGVSNGEIAYQLLEKGDVEFVLQDDTLFSAADKKKVLKAVTETGIWNLVAPRIDSLPITEQKSRIAEQLIESGYAQVVQENMGRFLTNNKDHKRIVKALLENGDQQYVVENIHRFRNIDVKQFVGQLLEQGLLQLVVDNINKLVTGFESDKAILDMIKAHKQSGVRIRKTE